MDVTKIQATDKLWGKTWPVFLTRHCEVWAIEVVAGGYCSRHVHHYKSNCFFVKSGSLFVRWWDKTRVKSKFATLRAGDSFDIEAGVAHQFQVFEPTVAIETYYSEEGRCSPEDIQRFSVGGVHDGCMERGAE